MGYVEGVLLPISKEKKQAYIDHALHCAEIFKDYGMISMVECWGDDVPDGAINSMRSAVMLEDDETVVFSWMTWADKAARDSGWEKIMADPRMNNPDMEMPFDGKRMIFGGFVPIVTIPA